MTKNDKVHAQQQRVRPGPEYKLLDIFVGKWKTEGQIKATSSSPAARLTAVDTYEWPALWFFPYSLRGWTHGRCGGQDLRDHWL